MTWREPKWWNPRRPFPGGGVWGPFWDFVACLVAMSAALVLGVLALLLRGR